MDTRKRGMRSLPGNAADEGYASKRAVVERKSFPMCPPQPAKPLKRFSIQKYLFPERVLPKAVFFTKPVLLSKLYDPSKDSLYLDQIFSRHGLIGEGSFGEVYKVKSREDDKIYALKQFKRANHKQYGCAEVRNLEKIGAHPNCVQFFMAWEEDKIIYIQMEFCNMSLAKYSTLMVHNFPESQLWEILYDVLQALNHLHRKNLIHLDVKPDNIMMSKGVNKLADFGLLVDLNKLQLDGHKISTISDGDAKYLASEVLDGIYTYACDIFGLGISLVELASDIELPGNGQLWHHIRNQYLPSSFYGNVTAEFAVTVERLMTHDYHQRPPAAKVLKYSALKRVTRKDRKWPRQNYCATVDTDHILLPPSCPSFNSYVLENNNIVETPKRPLYEVYNRLSHSTSCIRDMQMDTDPPKHSEDLCKDLREGKGPDGEAKRNLTRVKLAF